MAEDVYHVTFTKNLPDIQKRGLDPLSQSLWAKQETGERYQQEPSVYGFTNPEDALSWAGRMSWDFRDEAGKHSDYSIIRLKGGEHWEDDPSEDNRLTGARPSAHEDRGRSVRYQGHIKPEDIVSITQFPEGAGVNEEFKAQFPEGMYDEWIKYYGDQLRGLPQDEPRSTDTDSPATVGWGAGIVTPEMQRQNPVWRFLEETYPGQSTETGLIEYTIDDEAAISLVPTSPKTLKIDSLRALKKNTGAGTRALNLLSRQADKHGVTLEGLVHKFEEEGLSKADLMKFYQKAGWELRYPDKVERSLSEGKTLEDIRVEMLRSPRSTDLVPVATPPEEEEHKPGLPRLTGVGQMFRGIGSMLGGKKMQAVRKLIAMAQQGYELLPEDRQLLGEVLDMEALTKQVPGTGKGVDYFRQLLGMGPEEGGITSLPMDEASRTARATEQGFNIDSYHGTRGDFTTFEKGDLGYHFGSTEQANTRLWMRRSRGENPDMMWTDEEIAAANRGEPLPQENIMPVKLRLHNPLELPDVGHWQRPEVIIRRTLETEWGESRADELQDLEDKSDKLREPYGFMDDWAASPEASEIMDELRDLMKKDGYDGIKYRNIVEIEYDEEDAPTAGADPYSYIVFDAENIRSRFAEFDPAQSESPDISKAAGGFVDKPLYERTL